MGRSNEDKSPKGHTRQKRSGDTEQQEGTKCQKQSVRTKHNKKAQNVKSKEENTEQREGIRRQKCGGDTAERAPEDKR